MSAERGRTGAASLAITRESRAAFASQWSAGWWILPAALLGALFWGTLAWSLTRWIF